MVEKFLKLASKVSSGPMTMWVRATHLQLRLLIEPSPHFQRALNHKVGPFLGRAWASPSIVRWPWYVLYVTCTKISCEKWKAPHLVVEMVHTFECTKLYVTCTKISWTNRIQEDTHMGRDEKEGLNRRKGLIATASSLFIYIQIKIAFTQAEGKTKTRLTFEVLET